jgi:hypothetical protein
VFYKSHRQNQYHSLGGGVRVKMHNATFNNISVISWWSVWTIEPRPTTKVHFMYWLNRMHYITCLVRQTVFIWVIWSHHFESFTVATMTWLIVTEYLFHKWSRIRSLSWPQSGLINIKDLLCRINWERYAPYDDAPVMLLHIYTESSQWENWNYLFCCDVDLISCVIVYFRQ